MNVAHLFAQDAPIPAHAVAALFAIVLGAWQLWASKGDQTHRYLGYVWVSLMVFVSISSFWIHSLRMVGPFGPIHLLSILTIWTAVGSIRAARAGNIAKHKTMMKFLYGLGLLLTGLFTLLPGRAMHTVVFS